MIVDKEFLSLLRKRRKELYKDPDSILKKYHKFLESNYIYPSENRALFEKDIKGRKELCEGILKIYDEVKYAGERKELLRDLHVIGYDKNKLTELVLDVFYFENLPSDLWGFGDLLYTIKNYRYMEQYMTIIQEKRYGINRQMVVLLVGKSKKTEVIPVLKELLNDPDVHGHALNALANFLGEDIENIMRQYCNYEVTWIRNIAKRYLKKRGIEV